MIGESCYFSEPSFHFLLQGSQLPADEYRSQNASGIHRCQNLGNCPHYGNLLRRHLTEGAVISMRWRLRRWQTICQYKYRRQGYETMPLNARTSSSKGGVKCRQSTIHSGKV